MSPKRGDRAAPPHVGDEYDIRFDNAESAKGWDELARVAPANRRRAFDTIRARFSRLNATTGSAAVFPRPTDEGPTWSSGSSMSPDAGASGT